jgi:hypothetical protein
MWGMFIIWDCEMWYIILWCETETLSSSFLSLFFLFVCHCHNENEFKAILNLRKIKINLLSSSQQQIPYTCVTVNYQGHILISYTVTKNIQKPQCTNFLFQFIALSLPLSLKNKCLKIHKTVAKLYIEWGWNLKNSSNGYHNIWPKTRIRYNLRIA